MRAGDGFGQRRDRGAPVSTSNFFDAIQRIKLLLDGLLPEQAEEHIRNKTVKRSGVQQTEKERGKQLRG